MRRKLAGWAFEFWLEKGDAISNLIRIRDLLFERKIAYESTSLLVHLMLEIVYMNQFSASRIYYFLAVALQASLDAL